MLPSSGLFSVHRGGDFLYNSEPLLGWAELEFMSNICTAHLSLIITFLKLLVTSGEASTWSFYRLG